VSKELEKRIRGIAVGNQDEKEQGRGSRIQRHNKLPSREEQYNYGDC
jgi:hypothetical protein